MTRKDSVIRDSRAYLLREDGGATVRMICPYNADFLADMKAQILPVDRIYDVPAKHWLFSAEVEDELVNIMSGYFDIIQRVELAGTNPPPPRSVQEHTPGDCLKTVATYFKEEAIVGVYPGLRDESVIRAAYRARSLQLHPDIAGTDSTVAMAKLNRARDILLKLLK